MTPSLPLPARPALAAALLLLAGACQRADVPPADQPLTLAGEWRLAASGGGITGQISPVPAGQLTQLYLRPDSSYAQYHNGTQLEAGTWQVRRVALGAGLPDTTRRLQLSPTPPVAGQRPARTLYVTRLAATALHLTSGTGCPLVEHYARQPAVALLCGNP